MHSYLSFELPSRCMSDPRIYHRAVTDAVIPGIREGSGTSGCKGKWIKQRIPHRGRNDGPQARSASSSSRVIRDHRIESRPQHLARYIDYVARPHEAALACADLRGLNHARLRDRSTDHIEVAPHARLVAIVAPERDGPRDALFINDRSG